MELQSLHMKVNWIYLVSFIFLISACGEDHYLTLNEPGQTENSVTSTPPKVDLSNYHPDEEIVTASVFVVVVDEQKNPIENAVVKMNGKSYSTNKYGTLQIEDAEVNQLGAFYTVEKDGYFEGSRRFFPQANTLAYTTVQLLEARVVGTFASSEGGIISSPDGLNIQFPMNAIVDAAGNIYEGEVSVAATFLDPTNEEIGERMPGSLLAVNEDIEEVVLRSYGMAAVELFGSSNEELNIAPGAIATLRLTVPAELLESAPKTIPLWSFEDDEFGVWVEEGTATLEGSEYVGEVSHFSYWNCDIPENFINVNGRLLNHFGEAILHENFKICVEGTSNCAYGYTDGKGKFSGPMPKDAILEITLVNCFVADPIGPFDEDVNIGDVVVIEGDITTKELSISVVDCSQNPIENSMVFVEKEGNQIWYPTDENGHTHLTVLQCEGENVIIGAVDFDGIVEGDAFILGDETELIITACANEFVNETESYVIEKLDDEVVLFSSDVSVMIITVSSAPGIFSHYRMQLKYSNQSEETGAASQIYTATFEYIDISEIDIGVYDGGRVFLIPSVETCALFLPNSNIPGDACSDLTLTLSEFEYEEMITGGFNVWMSGNIEGTADETGRKLSVEFNVPKSP